MILALDTDVLVAWTMTGTPAHLAVRRLIEREVDGSGQIGITPQVMLEFIHVVTDPRRFDHPLEMDEAVARARQLWDARDVMRLEPGPTLLHRVLELMTTYRLGRKRLLDTALAVTLEGVGVRRLATLNGRDDQVFRFLDVVGPR